MSRLQLVPVHDEVTDPQPAAFHEMAAAKYIGMHRTAFRELLLSGLIPYAEHANGKTRIYLRADLDKYLRNLKWRTMTPREVSRVAHNERGH